MVEDSRNSLNSFTPPIASALLATETWWVVRATMGIKFGIVTNVTLFIYFDTFSNRILLFKAFKERSDFKHYTNKYYFIKILLPKCPISKRLTVVNYIIRDSVKVENS